MRPWLAARSARMRAYSTLDSGDSHGPSRISRRRPSGSRTVTQACPEEWRREDGGGPRLVRAICNSHEKKNAEWFCIPRGSAPHHSPRMGTLNLRSAEEFRQERAMGFEPTTSSLGSWHSTTELRPHVVDIIGFTSKALVPFPCGYPL